MTLRPIDRAGYAVCGAADRTGLFHYSGDHSLFVAMLRLPFYVVIYALAILATLTD